MSISQLSRDFMAVGNDRTVYAGRPRDSLCWQWFCVHMRWMRWQPSSVWSAPTAWPSMHHSWYPGPCGDSLPLKGSTCHLCLPLYQKERRFQGSSLHGFDCLIMPILVNAFGVSYLINLGFLVYKQGSHLLSQVTTTSRKADFPFPFADHTLVSFSLGCSVTALGMLLPAKI